MFTPKNSLIIEFAIGLAGTAFAGYLSAVKIFTDTCALGEACPYFLGYPTCYYGLAMFLTIAVIAGLGLFGKVTAKKSFQFIVGVAGLGTVFAGWFAGVEIVTWVLSPRSYLLILPACAYGLIFYVIAAVVAMRAGKVTSAT